MNSSCPKCGKSHSKFWHPDDFYCSWCQLYFPKANSIPDQINYVSSPILTADVRVIRNVDAETFDRLLSKALKLVRSELIAKHVKFLSDEADNQAKERTGI